MSILLGVCAFALFFLSDYNDWKPGRRSGKCCFPLGAGLLSVATILGCGGGTPIAALWLRGLFFVFAALFLGLLIHTLFFALPAAASYARPGETRAVVVKGAYALCRHPGVLCFVGLYACLWLAAGLPLWMAALYSGLNVLLVIFEDVCVFPSRLAGYEAYRRTTPFLLPNRRSIRACAGISGEE
ncbi:MAG: hypothetical protein RR350_06190 [Oscillibacter sp.]